MRSALLMAAVAAALFAAPKASAQSSPFGEPLPDQLVQGIMQIARQNITRARLADGSYVPAETQAELAQPILPPADGRRIVETSRVSAFARWCGVEWEQRSFVRLMRRERARQTWSPKQIAYIGLLHGLTMGLLGSQLEKRGTCPAPTRAAVEAHIARQMRR